MLSGFSTWPIRDVFVLVMLIFNAGGMFYLYRNHMSHMRKDIKDLLDRMGNVENRITRIEAKMEDYDHSE
jgi:Ca2+-dependent lipid-binding protein